MPLSYKDLTVRGRDGRRVPITNCNLEPLNLLIPGNAPIVVPKKHAWRSPSQQAKKAHRSTQLARLAVAQDDYEADSEEESRDDDGDDNDDDDTQPLIKQQSRSANKTKAKGRCRKDSIVKEKASEAKHRRKAERHQKKAELERAEAARERERLQRRIEKQEAYIMKLKARYEGAGEEEEEEAAAVVYQGARPNKRIPKTSSKTDKRVTRMFDTDDDDAGDAGDATTDGSDAVRKMLANMKIRAGGKETTPRFFAQPGDLPWTTSDDSQLLALKKGSDDSYAVIGECMGRRAGEVKRRYKYLKECDFQIPGENENVGEEAKNGEETTEGEEEKTTGAEMTDIEVSGCEKTDLERTDDENKDGGRDKMDAEKLNDRKKGGDDEWTQETDTQLWKLKNDGNTWAEIHGIMGGSKSGIKDRFKHLKSIDFKIPDEPTDAEKTGDGTTDAEKKQKDKAARSPPKAAALPRKKRTELSPTPQSSKYVKHNKSNNKIKPRSSSSSLPRGGGGDKFSYDDDDGTNAYIAQYARTLLADANAGRTSVPEPDNMFDESDCLLLALADSHWRENRWLEIQADYFNVTGRMVPLDVLQWKLGGGQKPNGLGDVVDDTD